MKKNDRLELIRKIVQENKITTQGELVKLLQNEGLKATQATVSRDINEMRVDRQHAFMNIVVQPGTSRLIKKILLDEYKHLIFSVIADDDTLFLVAQSELAAIELQGQIIKWVEE